MNNVIKRVVFLSFAAIFSSAVAWSAPMGVKIKSVIGKVETQTGETWKTVKDGDSLATGATLRTGAGASCILVWAGGNTVKLSPLSKMKVASVEKGADGRENSAFELSQGKMMAHAKKLPTTASTYSIKNPTAAAGVRGTDVFADVKDSGDSNIGVVSGSDDELPGVRQ